MKTKALSALLVVLMAVHCRCVAQTSDTYPILRLRDGTTYTNAQIDSVTASYVTVFFDGGGLHIPMTNLPTEIQQKYHYDPAAAAAAEKANQEKQAKAKARAAAAQQEIQKFESWTGDICEARVVKSRSGGGYQINVAGAGTMNVIIQGLPPDISTFVSTITSLREGGQTYGGASGGGVASAARDNANRASQLREMMVTEASTTAILVAPTKLQFAGLPVWRYMGRPSPAGYRARPVSVNPNGGTRPILDNGQP